MPEEKIDHAAEAIRVMGLAHNNADQDNHWRSDHQMKRAQVHATLALVEQQRIANLVALAIAETAPPEAAIQVHDVLFSNGYLATEYAPALGVGR